MEKKKDIGKHFIFKKDNKLEHYLGENVIFKPNFNMIYRFVLSLIEY